MHSETLFQSYCRAIRVRLHGEVVGLEMQGRTVRASDQSEPTSIYTCLLKRTNEPGVPTCAQLILGVGPIDNQQLTHCIPISAILPC